MAITRCPYCHAIIDENDKYCNNCGTQLLFNEDEEIEEEIPGEKIIEADVEEKDYTIDEPKGEARPAAAKDLDKEIDEELEEEELAAEDDLEGEEDGTAEEIILLDEIGAAAAAGARDGASAVDIEEPVEAKKPEPEPEPERGPKTEDEEPEGEEDDVEEGAEEELADELEEELEKEEPAPEALEAEEPRAEDETREYAAAPAPAKAEAVTKGTDEFARGPGEADFEYVAETEVPDEAATAGEAGLRPVTFDSKELDNLGKTVDLGREKVDRFIEVMASKEAGTDRLPPEPPEPAALVTPEPSTGTLPPWASTMKGAPVFTEDTGPVEPRNVRGDAGTPDSEEVEIFPRRRASDSTIGLPEKVSQVPLPFDAPPTPSEEGGEEAAEPEPGERGREEAAERAFAPEEAVLSPGPVGPAREPLRAAAEAEPAQAARPGIELAGEVEEAGPRPPFRFSVFIKSKAFDVLFVGLFWLVALWLAASSLGLTLFEILGSMSGPMLLLYAVFVLLYFFLFKFFLGETLGDRLFRPRE